MFFCVHGVTSKYNQRALCFQQFGYHGCTAVPAWYVTSYNLVCKYVFFFSLFHLFRSFTKHSTVILTWYFRDSDLGEITRDIGEEVSPRVTNFVNKLFGHCTKGHQAPRPRRFGQCKGTIRRAFDHREAHVIPAAHSGRMFIFSGNAKLVVFYFHCSYSVEIKKSQ